MVLHLDREASRTGVRSFSSYVGLCLISLVLAPPQSFAVEVTFTLDPAESYLTVTGTYEGFPLVAQGPGGDTARYTGEFIVDVDDPLAPQQLQFLSGMMLAQVTGDWLPAEGGGDIGDEVVDGDSNPGEPAPGNYGIYLDAGLLGEAWGAFRNLGFTITSEIQTVDNGRFEEFQTITVAQALWDTNLRSVALGDDASSDDVTGDNAPNDEVGTYTVEDNVAQIALPITLNFPGDVEFYFEGFLLGTAFVGPAMPGDFNQDQVLDALDINALTEVVILGTNDVEYDLNDDAAVNQEDRTIWVKQLRKTWFGDANLDGEFDTQDFVEVLTEGLYETGNPARWEQGDWSGDGFFGTADLVEALTDGGYELGPRNGLATVPEPSGLLLLMIGVGFFAVNRGNVVLSARNRATRNSDAYPGAEAPR